MKKIIFIATAVILVLIAVPKRAEAAVITGDEPVGGVSYYLDKSLVFNDCVRAYFKEAEK